MATYQGKTLEEKALELIAKELTHVTARAKIHEQKSREKYAEGNETGGRLRHAMAEKYKAKAITLAEHLDAIRAGKPDVAVCALRDMRADELEYMIDDAERFSENGHDSVVQALAGAKAEMLRTELRHLPDMGAEELMLECFGAVTDDELAVWSA